MPKTAFIGDVHGYAPALTRALEWCDANSIDAIIGLGDFVDGYDADEECIGLVKENFTFCIQGNHDEDHGKFMCNESRQWLSSLPDSIEHQGWLVTHSSPRAHHDDEYIRNSFEAWNCFDDCDFGRCVVGHAHRPMLYRYSTEQKFDSEVLDATGRGHILKQDYRYMLVNPSLAYNRTGQQNPGFSVFDSRTQRLQIVYLDMPQFKVRF